MSFTFAKSEVDFEYEGKQYSLKVDSRLGANLERHIDMHPVTLLIKINKCALDGEMPPMGIMAEVFEFMLKKSGVPADFDKIYKDLHGGENQEELARIVGSLLVLFIPATSDTPKTKPKRAAKK